jgi:DNA gyrase subunit A
MALVSGSLKSSLIFFSSAGSAYTTRFNDVPTSTGYGDPVQKLFKFDDGERVIGALSLDPRLPIPTQMVGVSKDGYGMRFNLETFKEQSTRSGRRFAKAGQGDEIIGVSACTEKDLLAVVTKNTNALVCKVNEVNELAGPGRGVTVIKTAEDDQVMAFLCTSKKDAELNIETTKGKNLKLTPVRYEVTGRGGKGREMSKKDTVKSISRPLEFVTLPEAPKEKK